VEVGCGVKHRLRRQLARCESMAHMGTWLAKTFGIALLTFFGTYIAFVIYCVVGYTFSPRAEPVPVLLWGIPVGAMGALVAVIVRFVLKNPD
jgi:hypothetical protein